MKTEIFVWSPDQDYVQNWARYVSRSEICSIMQYNRLDQCAGRGTLSGDFSEAEIDSAIENLNNKMAWKKYRYREFWSDRQMTPHMPMDARKAQLTLYGPDMPVDARKAGPAPAGISYMYRDKSATPAFLDPKGVLYYKSKDPFHSFAPSLYVYMTDVETFCTREEFIKRFKRIMIPVLLNIVHGYWFVPPDP